MNDESRGTQRKHLPITPRHRQDAGTFTQHCETNSIQFRRIMIEPHGKLDHEYDVARVVVVPSGPAGYLFAILVHSPDRIVFRCQLTTLSSARPSFLGEVCHFLTVGCYTAIEPEFPRSNRTGRAALPLAPWTVPPLMSFLSYTVQLLGSMHGYGNRRANMRWPCKGARIIEVMKTRTRTDSRQSPARSRSAGWKAMPALPGNYSLHRL